MGRKKTGQDMAFGPSPSVLMTNQANKIPENPTILDVDADGGRGRALMVLWMLLAVVLVVVVVVVVVVVIGVFRC